MIPPKAAVALFLAGAIAGLLGAALLSSAPAATPPPDGPAWIGELLWSERAVEAILQAFIVLAGTFAIVLLIPRRRDVHG